jgi:hypothetical protein
MTDKNYTNKHPKYNTKTKYYDEGKYIGSFTRQEIAEYKKDKKPNQRPRRVIKR